MLPCGFRVSAILCTEGSQAPALACICCCQVLHSPSFLPACLHISAAGVMLLSAAGASQQQAAAASNWVRAAAPPAFHLIPESQPVLPCLLRRLLLRGSLNGAIALARQHVTGPHFSRSLEWLLFTALEASDAGSSSSRQSMVSIWL
jgi:hypothetical protein